MQVEQLFNVLKTLKIDIKQYTHEPLFTVEQARKVAHSLSLPENSLVKNLFLKDSKKRVWLIVAHANTVINLKKISKILQAPQLHFTDKAMLNHYLKVEPGAVTPLALINDTERVVTVVLDKKIFDASYLGVHPLKNNETVTLSPHDLKRFITYLGYTIVDMDFTRE